MSSLSNLAAPSVDACSRTLHRIRYRVGQFRRGLTARVAPEEQVLVGQILTRQAQALFERLPVDVQRHSLNVLHAVHATGVRDPDLDAAALLHDVGKLAADAGGVRLNPWLRSSLVLLEASSPHLLARVANANPASAWRYAAYVHREHPRLGAEMATAAGCSELTCWLIQHHQDHKVPGQEIAGENRDSDERRRQLLQILQAADNSS